MHELSIALSMIDGVLEEARKQGEVRVAAVHLKLGIFSGVDKEALEFSYGLACEGTPLEGSRLVIEQIPILMYCSTCKAEHTLVSMQQLCCPSCQAPADDIRSGRELEVTALEVLA
jgi:hydrogenase nickel incorporation protein HypA/HybF